MILEEHKFFNRIFFFTKIKIYIYAAQDLLKNSLKKKKLNLKKYPLKKLLYF